MKKQLLIILLALTTLSAYAQKKKKTGAETIPAAFAMLTADQKAKVTAIHKAHSQEMKSLLQQPVQDPRERRKQIEKLRMERDSSLKVLLGEQTYNDYRKAAVTKKND